MQIILNQLVYFGFLQSLLLLVIYISSPAKRKNLNPYLAFLVFILMFGLLGRVLNATEIFGKNFRFIAMSEFSNLLFGATIYLLTRSIVFSEKFKPSSLVHYLPAVFYVICLVYFHMLPSDEIIIARVKTGELRRSIYIFIGFALSVNVFYYLLSLKTFIGYKKSLTEEYSFSVSTYFLRNLLIAIGICLAFWITVYFLSFSVDYMIERNARNWIWTSIALIILFISSYMIIEPNVFKTPHISTSKKYAQSKLSNTDLDILKDKLDQLMIDKKPYLNRKLMKSELAESLGVSNPEIARLLNERIGMNFFEYVNYFRIKEFIRIAQKDKLNSLTLFAIAQEAGFNSKTTFNKSFKKIMGTSPTVYFQENTK